MLSTRSTSAPPGSARTAPHGFPRTAPAGPTSTASPRCRRTAPAALLAAFAFALLAWLVVRGTAQNFDARVAAHFEQVRVPHLVGPALALDVLGTWWVITPLAGAFVLTLAGLRLWRPALYVASALAASVALNLVLKSAIGRDRPDAPVAFVAPSTYAFPSGHTMTATTLAVALVLLAWSTGRRPLMLVPAVAFIVAMGLSRVYLGAHWPSDVLAGWALGFCVAWCLARVFVHGHGAGRAAMRCTERPSAGEKEGGCLQPEPATDGTHVPDVAAREGPVILLDWGGTLMVDDGSQRGPMAGWERVEAVAGAHEALRQLRARHRLVVATNAQDSTAADVCAALARVGLADLVDGIVTSRDLGVAKPAAAFFAAASPSSAVPAIMVGDSWMNDIAGARAAGLRTIWLNPTRAPRPAGARPPDAEIRSLADLPAAVRRLT